MTATRFESLKGKRYHDAVKDQLNTLDADETQDDPAKLVSLDAWQMRAVWPELTHREGG